MTTNIYQQLDSQSTCPDCNSPITHDPKRGESACIECGMIINEDAVDHGPEWTAYTASEREERPRAGQPTSPTIHDKGLSTTIGWQDKDANGNALTTRQRQQMQRLRTWNGRYCTGSEYVLKQALGEIHRMSSAFGLPQPVRETACVIYRRATAENLVVGRSIEGIATSALYAATRQHGVPRTLKEVTTVARVEQRRIGRDYRYIANELGLAIEPNAPTEYLPRFASELECSEAVHRQAYDLLIPVMGTTYMSGKHPDALAAAALYASAVLNDAPFTQDDIAKATNVTNLSVRNHYRDLLAHAEDMPPEQAIAAARRRERCAEHEESVEQSNEVLEER